MKWKSTGQALRKIEVYAVDLEKVNGVWEVTVRLDTGLVAEEILTATTEAEAKRQAEIVLGRVKREISANV